LPPIKLRVARVVEPSRKFTEPTGVVVGDVTVAVNFTVCPALDVLVDEVSDVALAAGFTV
jgi:hypothetical protein